MTPTRERRRVASLAVSIVGAALMAFGAAAQPISQIIGATGDGQHVLANPKGVAADDLGNVYVAGFVSNNVFKISPGGAISQIIGATGDGPHALTGPQGVAVDGSGNVYVTGYFSNNAFKITPGGAIRQIIGATGDGQHALSAPEGVAVDSLGNVFVTGSGSNNAFKITAAGVITQILDESGDGTGRLTSGGRYEGNGLYRPRAVAVDGSGNAYVVGFDGTASRTSVFKIPPTGAITEILGVTGGGVNTLWGSMGVAVDALDNVYVTGTIANVGGGSVYRITPQGVATEIISRNGDGRNGLDYAVGVAVDCSGNVHVTGLRSNNAFKLTPGGVITQIIDASGDGAGPATFGEAYGVAVDGLGNVYVTGAATSSVFKVSAPVWTSLGPAPINNGQTANQVDNYITGRREGGEPVTGRVTGIAAHPTEAGTIYLAAGGGGVWKTTDGGGHWTPLTDHQATLRMGAIALAPSNPEVVYAGTGSPGGCSVCFSGQGILKSTDGGATWTLSSGNPGRDELRRTSISRIVVHPTDPDTVYATVSFAFDSEPSPFYGVIKSTNGGATWEHLTAAVASPSTYTGWSDLLMHPDEPDKLWAAADGLGVVYSTNAGRNWAELAMGLPDPSNIGSTRLALAPTQPDRMFVAIAVASGPRGGSLYKLIRSDNGGSTWADLTDRPLIGSSACVGGTMATCDYLTDQGNRNAALAVHPTDANKVFAAGTQYIRASADGGESWYDISGGWAGVGLPYKAGPHADHWALTFDATGRLLDGNDGGIFRLDDSTPQSYSWTTINGDLAITEFYDIALHPTEDSVAYGAAQDNGTSKYSGGLPWEWIDGGDGFQVDLDHTQPDTVYNMSNGPFERSDDGGMTWVKKQNGLEWMRGFAIDPSNPLRLLAHHEKAGFFESTNRADAWTQVVAPGTNGYPTNTIQGLAVAPSDPRTLYAYEFGTSRILSSTNGGVNWSTYDARLPNWPSALAVDPLDSRTVYVARPYKGPLGPPLIRSTDGGATWQPFVGTGATQLSYEAFAVAVGTDKVYVGTGMGVYESPKSAPCWSKLGVGLPNVRVTALELLESRKRLAAGTLGRGLWRLNLP